MSIKSLASYAYVSTQGPSNYNSLKVSPFSSNGENEICLPNHQLIPLPSGDVCGVQHISCTKYVPSSYQQWNNFHLNRFEYSVGRSCPYFEAAPAVCRHSMPTSNEQSTSACEYISRKIMYCIDIIFFGKVPRVKAIYSPFPSLDYFVKGILEKLQLSFEVVLVSLYYMIRIQGILPDVNFYFMRVVGMHPFKILHSLSLSCMILSCKFLFDDTFSNDIWSQVSCSMFTITEINYIEMIVLKLLDYKLWPNEEVTLNYAWQLFCQ